MRSTSSLDRSAPMRWDDTGEAQAVAAHGQAWGGKAGRDGAGARRFTSLLKQVIMQACPNCHAGGWHLPTATAVQVNQGSMALTVSGRPAQKRRRRPPNLERFRHRACSLDDPLQPCRRLSSFARPTLQKVTAMSRFNMLPALLLAASLAACAQGSPSANAPPTSTNSNSASQMPQPPNSLPDGASVNAPIAGQTGVVGTTEVASPVRRVSARRPARRSRPSVRRARPSAATPASTQGTAPQ